MEAKKAEARTLYFKAKEEYTKNPTTENWIAFCNAKISCMHLGVLVGRI